MDIAHAGGPQAPGVLMMARQAATELRQSLSPEQQAQLRAYAAGGISAMVFNGLQAVTAGPPPLDLPPLSALESERYVLCLAARNQILLNLVDHRAFAYDMDNDGQIVRLVGNFKGGGKTKLDAEPVKIELSSHSGLALGPHTEAPYWCSVEAQNGHSPAPSALILTALWNPMAEPTTVIPLRPILEKLGTMKALALTLPNFNFTRSDSFVDGKGESGRGVSILKYHEKAGFVARFNAYRFSVDTDAPQIVHDAYAAFCQAVNTCVPIQYVLSQQSALIINNDQALHCRDTVRDNRRLLVRLFGYASYVRQIVLNEDPLLVRG